MKFLVTGAAGFIGFHTTEYLLNRGYTVVGVDNLNDYYDISLKEARLTKLQNKIESVGNIHPEYRTVKPKDFLKKTQEKFDQISDSRLEISNCMSRKCYNKTNDDES